MSSPRQKVIKDASFYSFSIITSTIIAFLQGFLVAKILEPAAYGQFQAYRIILLYSNYSSLGILWAMLREIPYHRGKNDSAKIEEIKNVTFSANFFISVILAFILLIISFFIRSFKSERLGLALGIVALTVVAQQAYYYLDKFLMSGKKFTLRSKATILFAFFNLFFVLILGVAFKLTGVLASITIAYVLVIIYIVKKVNFHFQLLFHLKEIWRLTKIGTSIMVNGLLYELMKGVDKLMILGFLGTKQLGYYGIAIMAVTSLSMIYSSIMITIFPRMAEKHGQADNLDSIYQYVMKPLLVMAYLSPLFIGSIFLIVHPIMKYVLPEYMPGLAAARIIILSSFFICLQEGIINFFITLNKIYKIYPLRIITIILNASLIFISIKMSKGITAVAFCTGFAFFFFATGLILYFLSFYSAKLRKKVQFMFELYFPFIYMVAMLFTLNFVYITHKTNLIGDMADILFRLAIFAILNIPLFVYVDKRTKVINEIKILVKHKFNRAPILAAEI